MYGKEFLVKVLNTLSSIADKEGESPKRLREHRSLIYLGTLMSIGGLIWGSISLSSGIFHEALIPYSYAVVTLFNFIYLYLTKDFKRAQFVQVLISLLLPFVFQLFLGGFIASGAVVLWSVLTILVSFTFQSRVVTLRWFVAYLLLLLTSGLVDSRSDFAMIKVPTEVSVMFITLNITLISVIIFSLFYYFVSSEEKLQGQLELLANTDPLTELLNRRGFFLQADMEFERIKRGRDPFAVLMLDIDHFKEINDRYGHGVGDKALCLFAAFLKSESRSIDIIGRYGGEEFIVLLPETSLKEAMVFTRRIIEKCHDIAIETPEGSCRFTVSAGLCRLEANTSGLLYLIKCADDALYQAKDAGRDRLCVVA